MFRPLARSHRPPHRRGTSFVLIVVVMISFAAAVGVAFALFAGQALRTSTAYKEAAGAGGQLPARAPEPANTVNRFFSALVFDADDSDEGVTNALRGHSIARSMYGGLAGNTVPWAGVGTFRESMIDTNGGTPAGPYDGFGLTAGDRSLAVNYTQMKVNNRPFLLDPEYRGIRTFTGSARNALTPAAGREYIGKHAGYSYADLKDFFSAAVDPATGQVLVPSFHRPWLWNETTTSGTTTTTSTLDPSNPKWYNTDGKFKTLRPRPAEHPKFPRVAPNADGTTTGDVQNWPGGYVIGTDSSVSPAVQRYYARNDSLWMHIGLPPVPFGNRKVQPLVAPLVVPLDGLLNVSAHGNAYGLNGAHASYAGYGPWEVNLGRIFGQFGPATPEFAALQNGWQAVVGGRGAARQRNGTSAASYDPYRQNPPVPPATAATPMTLPAYAPIVWDPVVNRGAVPPAMETSVTAPVYPSGANLTGLPGFAAAGFQSNNQALVGHPSLFNPAQWNQFSGTRVYALSELKRMHLRYAFTPDWYQQSELATQFAPGDLFPSAAFTYAIRQNTINSYRIDPTHRNRALLTPTGFGLDRPKVAPTFLNGGTLVLGANGKPGQVATGPFPAPGNTGALSDFESSVQWVNKMAVLGSVDVNRPLADYRVNLNAPLSAPNNVTVTSAGQADNDRRKLAHDIFVRLAVATGAPLPLNSPLTAVEYPQYQYPTPVAAAGPQLDTLRYLAQLAVNIVDYRDDDDVSTAFVWNPIAAAVPADPTKPGGPNDPRNFDPAEVGTRVVFGVERPRLVLNEVYSEITNDPNDPVDGPGNGNGMSQPLPANRPAHVKFWAELLNPTTPTGGNGLVEDAVPLGGYQIEIARGRRETGLGMGVPPQDTVSALYLPGNTTGSLGLPADAVFPLALAVNIGAGGPTTVSPNNGVYAPPFNGMNTLPSRGFVLVGPTPTPVKAGSDEFNPQSAGEWSDANAVRSPGPGPAMSSQGMGYTLSLGMGGEVIPGKAEYRRHVVLLRRKANPYLADPANANAAPPSNPFITVDMMDYVPSFDALHRDVGQGQGRGRGNGKGAGNGNANGFDPVPDRFSIGKVQPYAGHSITVDPPADAVPGNTKYNAYSFPSSMVLAQTTAATPPNATKAPKNTFGRHNGTQQPVGSTYVPANLTAAPATPAMLTSPNGNETIMAPFDWLVHMDRRVVNNVELFQVRDTPPHLVTDQFIRSNGATAPSAPDVIYDLSYAPWTRTNNGIARALEYLTTKPHTAGVPHGGRIPGQVGINALTDKRVLNALFDPQANANYFDETFVNNNAWNRWMASRSQLTTRTLASPQQPPPPPTPAPNPAPPETVQTTDTPRQTVYDGGGADNPFFSLGAPAAAGGGFAFAGGSSEEQTVLRTGGGASPMLYTGPLQTVGGTANGAVYFPPEPLRKVMNNISTVNHTYLVYLTIGYFELDGTATVDLGAGLTMPRLAHEAYLNVPGDMRQKFTGVIDMSAMAMDPASSAPAARPFFTTLDATARPAVNPGTGAIDPTIPVTLSVTTDGAGNAVDVAGIAVGIGGKLVIGYGTEQQTVDVVPNAPTPGQVTVTGLTRTAWAGTVVSNARPGYPGVQGSAFSYTDPKYKPVVPYLERLK